MSDAPEVTVLLRAWRDGDEEALACVVEILERDLRAAAGRCLAGDRAGRSLSATDLVHEAFLRLVGLDGMAWQDRGHFLAMAARTMRRVLVDRARARGAEKRGGDAVRITLADLPGPLFLGVPDDVLVRLDDALAALATLDARKAQVVDLRFFAGFDVDETARALGVSAKTVLRDWAFARAWLQRELARDA